MGVDPRDAGQRVRRFAFAGGDQRAAGFVSGRIPGRTVAQKEKDRASFRVLQKTRGQNTLDLILCPFGPRESAFFCDNMDLPRLWIALTRPDNLVTALAIAVAARGHFSGCVLVYEQSGWWKNAAWDEHRSLFDAVHTVPKVPACRGLRDVPRFYRALARRQRTLADLRIAPGDTLITLAGITALSNALASAYPAVRKILAITLQKYVDANRPYSFRRYRHTTSGFLQNRFLEPRVGLWRTLHLKPWYGHGDGIRLKRLEAALETVFDRILLLSNDGQLLPPDAGPQVQPAPFPSVEDLRELLPAPPEERDARRKVVFFGTPFLLVRNLAPDVYAARLDACLDALRRWYAPACELVYRPHPAETRERTRLRLDGFTVEDDGQVAELYFLREHRRIEAVFSVSSTVSRVALNLGLDGYALWRCFPFDRTAAAFFESLMGRVPPEFEVRSLEEPPPPYAARTGRAAGASGFSEALAAVGVGGLTEATA